MKKNLTKKLIKINLALVIIITLIFIGLNVCGYKCYSVNSDTLVSVFKKGDLVYIKDDNLRSSDIYINDSRNMSRVYIDKEIIRFPYLGYVRDFVISQTGKTILFISTILIILLTF